VQPRRRALALIVEHEARLPGEDLGALRHLVLRAALSVS
jgi:hypothetical protein